MTESPESLKIRLKTAAQEMKSAVWFDHIVINHENQLDSAVSEIQSIVKIARTKQHSQWYLDAL